MSPRYPRSWACPISAPGQHTTPTLKMPRDITLFFLPSRSPGFNPLENIWQYLRANWLSNDIFKGYDAIIDAACQAWRNLIDQPQAITSTRSRK